MGAAYIFALTNDNWFEEARLEAGHRELKGAFGVDVSISGEYAVVGACGHGKYIQESSRLEDAGAAYIFKRDSSGNWLETQRIVSPTPTIDGKFGLTVFMTEKYMAISATREKTNFEGRDTMERAGAVYVYELNESGQWSNKQKITLEFESFIINPTLDQKLFTISK